MTKYIEPIRNILMAGAMISMAMVNAQEPHAIQVQVEGLNNDTVYLAHYYGNKLYYSDTTITDAKGNLTFPPTL